MIPGWINAKLTYLFINLTKFEYVAGFQGELTRPISETILKNRNNEFLIDYLIGNAHGSAQLNLDIDELRKFFNTCIRYEDIFDLEVSDTSLVRARKIEREVGLRKKK